jgi:hypothetical protein
MVMQALQYLHGFDMTYRSSDRRLIGHGHPGPYLRTFEQVAAEFDAWCARCAGYDADPAGWVAAHAVRLRPPSDDNASRGSDAL